jgi:hypothetical protein
VEKEREIKAEKETIGNVQCEPSVWMYTLLIIHVDKSS